MGNQHRDGIARGRSDLSQRSDHRSLYEGIAGIRFELQQWRDRRRGFRTVIAKRVNGAVNKCDIRLGRPELAFNHMRQSWVKALVPSAPARILHLSKADKNWNRHTGGHDQQFFLLGALSQRGLEKDTTNIGSRGNATLPRFK